jgi:hypothetical protein
MSFALLPGEFPSAPESAAGGSARHNYDLFMNSPEYGPARLRLQNYSDTIISALRGPEVREISASLREQAVAKSYWGEGARFLSSIAPMTNLKTLAG